MDKEFALEEAIDLIDDIMRGMVNPEDECEKFLRAFAPDKLRDDMEFTTHEDIIRSVNDSNILLDAGWVHTQADQWISPYTKMHHSRDAALMIESMDDADLDVDCRELNNA